MGPREFQLLMIFWQLGLVNTFNVLKLCVNGGSQYLGVILSSAAGNTTQLGVKTVLEPILGFGTSYQFIMAAANAVERRQRIATLASFLAASAGALTTDPTTNAAMGAAVASKIAYMKAILATRGGSQQLLEYVLTPSLKNYLITVNPVVNPLLSPLLSPAQIKLQETNKLLIQNMFQEHTARRYLNGLAQKIKPTAYLAPIASTQIKTTALIGFTILGSLYLFQRAERLRSQNHEVIIDVTASSCD
jgi:hypothetical protein